MEILRGIVIVIHILAVAGLLIPWIIEAVSGRRRFTRVMQWSMVLIFVAGLVLMAPWGLDGRELNYVKLAIKFVILLAVGAFLGIGGSRQRKGKSSDVFFWLVGALTVADLVIALVV